MSSKREEHDFTSIYSAPPKPQTRTESALVNYDYLDTSDHSEYTNAWLNAVSYDKVSVDYCDEYEDNWVNFMKTAERMTERKIKYTRSQLINILSEMTSSGVHIPFIVPEIVYRPTDFTTKTIYQPIRQPNNPPDNIVKGFISTYQLCARCRARIV